MTTLYLHGDPALVAAGSVKRVLGQCVAVLLDGTDPGVEALWHYVRVQTDKPLAECVATYMKEGVPDDVTQALQDSRDALHAAQDALRKTDPKDFVALAFAQKALDDAQAAMEAAADAASGWPERAVAVDLSMLPPGSADAPPAVRAALQAVAADAKAAAKAAVADVVATTMLPLEFVDPLLHSTKEIVEAQTDDRTRDALLAASAAGRRSVERAAVQSVAVPDAPFVDSASLDAMTFPVKP